MTPLYSHLFSWIDTPALTMSAVWISINRSPAPRRRPCTRPSTASYTPHAEGRMGRVHAPKSEGSEFREALFYPILNSESLTTTFLQSGYLNISYILFVHALKPETKPNWRAFQTHKLEVTSLYLFHFRQPIPPLGDPPLRWFDYFFVEALLRLRVRRGTGVPSP